MTPDKKEESYTDTLQKVMCSNKYRYKGREIEHTKDGYVVAGGILYPYKQDAEKAVDDLLESLKKSIR